MKMSKFFFALAFVTFIGSALCAQATPDYDVIIVGGGGAGLTTGFYLQERDVNFMLFEAEEVVGGRAAYGKRREFNYTKGVEYLGKPIGAFKDMLKKLDVQAVEIPYPQDAILSDGEIYVGKENIFKHLIEKSSFSDFRNFLDILQDVFSEYEQIPNIDYSDDFKRLDNISAGDWFRENNIPQCFIDKYNIASFGLYGATLDQISALSVVDEAIFDFDPKDLLLTCVEDFHDTGHTRGYSFLTGFSEFTSSLHKNYPDKVRCNTSVESITKNEETGFFEVVTLDKKTNKQNKQTCSKIVLAVPVPIALSLAAGLIDEPRKKLLQQIPYSQYVCVALFTTVCLVDQCFDLEADKGMFFTDLYNLTWIENELGGKCNQGEYLTGFYIAAPGGYTDRSLLAMSDDQLLENIYADLKKIYPDIDFDQVVTGYDIHRFKYAYPVMTLGAYGRLIELNKLNMQHDEVILAGDYMIYPTLEMAVESGKIAADIILR